MESSLTSAPSFPASAEGLDPEKYHLPDQGLDAIVRVNRLRELRDHLATEVKPRFLGYQANQALRYKEAADEDVIASFLNMHVNNLGDPFSEGGFKLNSKVMEQAVLDYLARRWHAGDDFWGYVLSMGSTEGNLYGLWNARDYLAGRKLRYEQVPKHPTLRRARWVEPAPADNPYTYVPVAFYSQDSHYSIVKAMRVLGIKTFWEVGRDRGLPIPIPGYDKWEDLQEVPSKDGNEGPGCIDVGKLRALVDLFAREGYAILVSLNVGSTFKGAYDDVTAVADLLPNLVPDRHIEGETHPRTGYWIHVDGALGAGFLPYVERAKERGLPLPDKGVPPSFDFRNRIHSLVTSGHKWPGAPWPCGVYMTRPKYLLCPPDDPEYIGSPDTTFAGSRNGFSAILLWDQFAAHGVDALAQEAADCLGVAERLRERLANEVQAIQRKYGYELWVERSPWSLTVRFRRPSIEVVRKYSLSCETLVVHGEVRQYAHVFVMRHLLDPMNTALQQLIQELSDPKAFAYNEVPEQVPIEHGRGWR